MNTYKVLVGLLLFGLVQTILFFTLTKKNSGITADGPEVYGNAGRRRRGGGNKYIEAYRRFKESYVPLKDYYPTEQEAQADDKYVYTKKCRENPDPRQSIPEEDICHPSHSEEEFAKLVPLTIVTAADSEYYDHLTNILGSIQLWEPKVQIAVYDLGLTKKQTEEVSSLCGVELIKFPFEKYPSYVNEYLSNFAWKALVIKEAVDRFGKIYYTDAGMEFRKPIDFIKRRINTDSYFCMGMSDSMTWGARPPQTEYFGYPMESFVGKPQIAGTIQGFTYWGKEYNGILVPAYNCSLNETCIIAPNRMEDEMLPFGKDQTIFSELLYLHSPVQCAMDPAFTMYEEDHKLPFPETKKSRQVLFHRRGRYPKPFFKYLTKFNSSTCKHPINEVRNDVKWREIKAQMKGVLGHRKTCTCMRELRPYNNYKKTLTLVTAAGSDWFEEAKNLVASIHKWEDAMEIVLYDLGLTHEQSAEARGWLNVRVVPFLQACERTEGSPAVRGNPKLCNKHVERGTWRPFVLLDAALTIGEYLFLHPGYEVVNTLHLVALQLYRDSVFSVTNEHDVLEFARPKFFKYIGAKPEFFEFKPLCTPNLFGYVCNKEYFYKVLLPVAQCARDYKKCWGVAFNGNAGSSGFTTDDVVMTSYLLNNTCYTCNRDTNVYDYFPHSNLPKTPTSLYWHLRRRIDVLVPRMKHPKTLGLAPKTKQ